MSVLLERSESENCKHHQSAAAHALQAAARKNWMQQTYSGAACLRRRHNSIAVHINWQCLLGAVDRR